MVLHQLQLQFRVKAEQIMTNTKKKRSRKLQIRKKLPSICLSMKMLLNQRAALTKRMIYQNEAHSSCEYKTYQERGPTEYIM